MTPEGVGLLGRGGLSAPTSRATSGSAPLRWRVLREDPATGAVNMARDHALARGAREGRGTLRLYGWVVPTVSFGRNEPVPEDFPREPAGRPGVDVVRRPTGGRAVLHHRERTYTVVVSPRDVGGARALYLAVHQAIAAALESLGVPARVAADGQAVPPDSGPCFRVTAPGEIRLGERKLVGSAQARLEGALLQHGSILLGADQGRLEALSGGWGSSALTGAASLDEVPGGTPPLELLDRALVEGLGKRLGGEWEESGTTGTEEAMAGELLRRYEDPRWTWRR